MKSKKNEVAAIKCEEAVVRFNDFMDNYLKGKAREELMKHIAECRHCMERFEFEQLLKSKVHELSGSEDKAMKKKIEELITSL
jgi:hypothetical protein